MLSTAMIVLEAGSAVCYVATVVTIALVGAFARERARREAARDILVVLLRGKPISAGTEEN